MRIENSFNRLTEYFSPKLRQALLSIDNNSIQSLHEIRLRIGRPVCVVSFGKEYFITHNGKKTDRLQTAVITTKEDIDYSFKAICEYSVHSFAKELSQGFITIPGGNRVGIAGTAVVKDQSVDTVKFINGLNFRIAGQVTGCAEEFYNKFMCLNPHGLLIAGSPASGKTTFIRDLCRLISQKFRVSLIDERGEIAAVYKGEPQNNIGPRCDVFDHYPKTEGIEIAVRVMNPDVIICDEIGGKTDANALVNSINSGVKIIAATHAENMYDVYQKKYIRQLIDANAFKYIISLGNGSELGKIKEIKYCDKKAELVNAV